MVIYLPGQSVDEEPLLDELTPREIVRELDKHVVGQAEAKRAVAIALRNRIRRQKLPPEMAEEVMPKNILMIGPTGVGKTELARRLARLANSPFLKVEASKFTEVGYVGRDVESMIRDLVDIAIDMVREERLDEVADRAEAQRRGAPARPADAAAAGDRARASSARARSCASACAKASSTSAWWNSTSRTAARRSKSPPTPASRRWASTSRTCCPTCSARRRGARKMRVAEALDYLVQEEEQKLIDMDQVTRVALERVESSGIIFLDEIDKIAGREGGPRSRRQPRGRAARHPADRRRHHGQYALRLRAHGPHPVHRRRRVPRLQAQRHDSRAAGPLPDPRGAEVAHRWRISSAS